MRLRRVGVLLMLMLCGIVLTWVSPALGAPQTDAVSPTVARGGKVYRRACASCHGRDGRGDGLASRGLTPRPRDLTSGKFKFRSTPSGSAPTEEDLYRIVTEGIPRTYMFGWKDLLSERERRDVVAYVRSLSDAFEEDARPVEVPAPTAATDSSIAEGRSLYVVLQCFRCHGREGKGGGPRADELVDDWGRPIHAFDFTSGVYKAGSDGESVFLTFETGLNGTPMPSYAEAFSFGSDAVRASSFAEDFPPDRIDELDRYLESQPTGAELRQMSTPEREALVSRRKWSLVHYVRSLTVEPGVFHWLFLGDTETNTH